MSSRILLMLVALSQVLDVRVSGELRVKYRTIQGVQIHPSEVNANVPGMSFTQCAARCDSKLDLSFCLSVTWIDLTGSCLMSSRQTFLGGQKSLAWESATELLYPVFLIRDSVNYNYTLPEARAQCESVGAVLATRSDLMEARALGLHQCSCGYMDDGSIGYVLQYEVTTCTSLPYTADIFSCDWRTTANAWCRFQDWK